jgi:hypothetical protein
MRPSVVENVPSYIDARLHVGKLGLQAADSLVFHPPHRGDSTTTVNHIKSRIVKRNMAHGPQGTNQKASTKAVSAHAGTAIATAIKAANQRGKEFSRKYLHEAAAKKPLGTPAKIGTRDQGQNIIAIASIGGPTAKTISSVRRRYRMKS